MSATVRHGQAAARGHSQNAPIFRPCLGGTCTCAGVRSVQMKRMTAMGNPSTSDMSIQTGTCCATSG
jgi:hypothetical protein